MEERGERRERKDDKRGRSREGRWWRFKATEVYFNGLFCIPLVAAGFWKTLHTVTISLAKGKKAKTQQQQHASPPTTHLITLTAFRDSPGLLKAFSACCENRGRILKTKCRRSPFTPT